MIIFGYFIMAFTLFWGGLGVGYLVGKKIWGGKLINFMCYLVDNHEGDTITEEFLVSVGIDFRKSSYFECLLDDKPKPKSEANNGRGVMGVKVKYHIKLGREHRTFEVDEPDDLNDDELQQNLGTLVSENVDSWFDKVE